MKANQQNLSLGIHSHFVVVLTFLVLFSQIVLAQNSAQPSNKEHNSRLLKVKTRQPRILKHSNKVRKQSDAASLRTQVAQQRAELDRLKQQEIDDYPDEAAGKSLIPGRDGVWINADNYNEKYVWESAHRRFVKKR